MQINQLLLGKQKQGKSQLTLKKTSNANLVANLNSERLKAKIHEKNGIWDLQLSDVNFDAFQSNHNNNELNPSKFPSLNLICHRCIARGQAYKLIKLRMSKKDKKSIINEVNISGQDYQFIANGSWQNIPQQKYSKTQLNIKKASIDKPGDFLKRMGNDVGIKKARTKITGNLNWQGSPMDFNLRTLSGDIHLAMQQGQLNDVQAGAGKLLGLLNFSKLSRRLRFDFSDVSGKGILFERITGDMKFTNGIVSTNNTIIESSIMLAGIKGQSDLLHKTHDQVITVIPDVKSALPVVGLIFGGVGVGAAVAAIDKLTEKNEKNQLKGEEFGTRYHVTGTWSDPSITDITPVGAPEDIYDNI